MKSRAFSLPELILSISLLAILTGMAFEIFDWSSTIFRVSNVRVELQGELRRVTGALRRDFLLSSFTSLSEHGESFTVPDHPPDAAPASSVERTTIAFATIEDISNPHNYDAATGQSMFDCWTVFCPYTDPSNHSQCTLYRYRIEKHTPSLTQLSMDSIKTPPITGTPVYSPFGTGTSYLWQGAGHEPLNLIKGTVRSYSNRIRSFSVEANLGDQTLVVKIALQGPSGHLNTGKKSTSEIVQTEVLLKAENTWPKL